MILTKFVKIKVIAKFLNHYKELGFENIKVNDMIDLDIKHMKPNSKIKIQCICENCDLIKEVSYASYYNSTHRCITNRYFCFNCSKYKILESTKQKYNVSNISQLESTKEKIKETSISKYNVDHFSQSDIVKKHKEETNIKKLGVDNPFKSNIIQENIKHTNIKLFGYDNPSKNEDIKNKKYFTCFNNFGVDKFFKIPDFNKNNYDKIIITKNNNTLNKWKLLVDNDDYEIISYTNSIFNIKHQEHTFNIEISNIHNRFNYSTLCTICNPFSNKSSDKENIIGDWIQNTLNIDIEKSNRKILSGKEIDIFIPKHNLAIEFNGLYWHSEKYHTKDYHQQKTLECLKQNIILLHVWEDDWICKTNIIKSIIIHKLKLSPNKIYARNCTIKIPTENETSCFYKNNSLYDISCSNNIGLYHNGILVSIMSFDENIMTGFCNIINTLVVGSFSKLFKHFLKTNIHKYIISFTKLDVFSGNVFEKNGFIKSSISLPDYTYIHKYKRYDKYSLNIDKKLKIYDSGQIKYIFYTKLYLNKQ